MKSLHTLAICATIFLVGFSCSKAINNGNVSSAASQDVESAPKAMIQKWEYTLGKHTLAELNELGKEGWEMVVKEGREIFLKRPIN